MEALTVGSKIQVKSKASGDWVHATILEITERSEPSGNIELGSPIIRDYRVQASDGTEFLIEDASSCIRESWNVLPVLGHKTSFFG